MIRQAREPPLLARAQGEKQQDSLPLVVGTGYVSEQSLKNAGVLAHLKFENSSRTLHPRVPLIIRFTERNSSPLVSPVPSRES